jgi:predicted Holliday junction resolvase-like endonuclease
MTLPLILIVPVLIICGMALYIRSIQKLMDKKDEEFRTKEAEMQKQVDEQAKKIEVLKSLVDGQDKILAMYREKKE